MQTENNKRNWCDYPSDDEEEEEYDNQQNQHIDDNDCNTEQVSNSIKQSDYTSSHFLSSRLLQNKEGPWNIYLLNVSYKLTEGDILKFYQGIIIDEISIIDRGIFQLKFNILSECLKLVEQGEVTIDGRKLTLRTQFNSKNKDKNKKGRTDSRGIPRERRPKREEPQKYQKEPYKSKKYVDDGKENNGFDKVRKYQVNYQIQPQQEEKKEFTPIGFFKRPQQVEQKQQDLRDLIQKDQKAQKTNSNVFEVLNTEDS